ncbi:hypothetical protein ACR3K2_04010 [Cryptosporidium serpentis]
MNLSELKRVRSGIYEENSNLYLDSLEIPKLRIKEHIENSHRLVFNDLDGGILKSVDKKGSETFLLCVFYSIPHDSTRVSTKTGQKYAIWNISDLREHKCKLYLFGEAFTKLINEKPGYLYLIFNPSIITGLNCSSISISSPDQVLKIGKVNGLSLCRGINRSGTTCNSPVDMNYQGPFCKYHLSIKTRQKSAEILERKNKELEKKINSNFVYNGYDGVFFSSKKVLSNNDAFNQKDKLTMNYRRVPNLNTKEANVMKQKNCSSQNFKRKKMHCKELSENQKQFRVLVLQFADASISMNRKHTSDILKVLAEFDMTCLTLEDIHTTGILDLLVRYELSCEDIDLAIMALKIRFRICNSKAYKPNFSVSTEKNCIINMDVRESLGINIETVSTALSTKDKESGSKTAIDISWKSLCNRINDRKEDMQEKISNQGGCNALISTILGGSIENKLKKQKKSDSKISKIDIIKRLDDALALNSVCEDAVRKYEYKTIQEKLNKLEEDDKIEQYRQTINSIYIYNAINCKICNTWSEGIPNLKCKDDHEDQLIYNQKALKEFWSCKTCQMRLQSICGYMIPYCPKCKEETLGNVSRISMYKKKNGPELPKESLIVRDGEVIIKLKDMRSVDVL